MTMIAGVELVECRIHPAQKALLDWGEQHPHSRIRELEFVDGLPMKIVVVTEDGLGTQLIRFDKMVSMKH